MCTAVLCNEPEPCVEDWKQEQQAKINRVYAPLLPPEDTLRRAVVAELRQLNALQPIPDPVWPSVDFLATRGTPIPSSVSTARLVGARSLRSSSGVSTNASVARPRSRP